MPSFFPTVLALVLALASAASLARADDGSLDPVFSEAPACDFEQRVTMPFGPEERIVLEPRAEPTVIDFVAPRLQDALGGVGPCGFALRYSYKALDGRNGSLHVEFRRGGAYFARELAALGRLEAREALDYGVCVDRDCFEREGELAWFYMFDERGVTRWRLTLKATGTRIEVLVPRMTWVRIAQP